MPTYTYHCDNCGVQFDQFQKFTDAPLTRCPECNKKTLRKVYSPVGIVFKGSGFYATDHRSPSGMNNHPGSTDKPAETKGEESKPATGESSQPSTPPAAKPEKKD
jgi:putative FmdB family regulatory protein